MPMTSRRIRGPVDSVLKVAAAILLLPYAAKGASELEKSWKNLGHSIAESMYTVVTREGLCITGRIESWDETSVTVRSLRVERKGVVRIGDDTSVADHDPLYSGRSSWSDLGHAEPNKYEHIRLDLKGGVTRDCRAFSATEEQATCDGREIEKPEVARGYYVRLAPATAWEHHALRESVPFLAPRTWFDFLFFPRITVLLYDAVAQQDNLKIECRVPAGGVAPNVPKRGNLPMTLPSPANGRVPQPPAPPELQQK